MRRLLAAVACFLAAPSAEAQVYRFRTYTSNTGLPGNAVYAIFQDSRGYMWFATDGGVSRYDGLTYVNLSVRQGLVDGSVRGIVEDREGGLWFLTKGGLSRWDGKRFRNFRKGDGLVHDEVRSGVRTRDGALWFGTTRGMSRWDGARFTTFGEAEGVPPEPVWDLFEDSHGALWAGLRGGGLLRFDGRRFVRYGRKEGLPDENVFDIAEDPSGGLWIATDGGLVRYDGTRFRLYTTANGLGSNLISSVLLDRHGRVWCGTFGAGLSRLEDGRFTRVGRQNGLPDEYVTALFKDDEQNVWMGGLWGGAYRFVSEQFTNYTSAAGVGEGLVSGVAEAPDGALWFSSINEGIVRLDSSGGHRRYGRAEGLADERIWTLFVDRQGRVWAGGLFGAVCLEGSRVRNFSLAQMGMHERINAIAEDRGGRIWFASGAAGSNGLVAWDGRGFTRYSTEDGLAHDQVNSLSVDRSGRLWVATEAGLSLLDGKRFRTWTTADGLPNKRAMVVYEDEAGVVWVGTGDGLARFDGTRFVTYTVADGLVNDYVRALTSQGGALWIGTARGISAFDGTTFRSYTVKDGLLSHEISTGTALTRRDGSVWFGTGHGAVRYRAVKQTAVAKPPRVAVTAVQTRDGAVPPGESLVLRHDRNSLVFEFLGLSFLDEEAVRYSYRLDGLEPEWSPPDGARSVRFTNLEPGRYHFLVRARSAAGLWSDPAGISLEIRPPVWRTWWARLLALAAAGGLAYAVYAGRMRAVEQRHRQRVAALRQLLESIRVINANLDLPTVLQSIAEESARLVVDAEPGGIGLVRENRVLFERVWAPAGWQAVDVSYPLGEGIAGRVAATGEAMIVNDVAADPRVRDPQDILARGALGLMDVPITDRTGRVVGVLDVRRPPGRAPFGEAERQLLASLAHQAAVAIENAALYGALEEKKVMITESLWAIEELYKNEQQLTRMLEEINRMKTNFMIVTSHEMRTPLTLLKGYHEALLEGYLGDLGEAQRQCLTLGHRTVDRMIESFNDILEMLQIDERRGVLDRSPLDVADLVRQVVGELAPFVERRRQRVSVDAPPGLPAVSGDPGKLRLVLLNVVENAIKFTPDGGEIRARLVPEPGAVRISITDTGIGIDAFELDRVFDRFYAGTDPLHHSSGTYQFKSRGAGLGLAIAKGHVEAHGGRIWAESDGSGKGSTFHVVLPLSAAAPAAAPVDVAAGP